MPKIIWEGSQEWGKEYPTRPMPVNASKNINVVITNDFRYHSIVGISRHSWRMDNYRDDLFADGYHGNGNTSTRLYGCIAGIKASSE